MRMPLLVLALLLATPSVAVAGADFDILTCGKAFHGGDVKASSAAGWLALYKVSDGFELVKVGLRVEPAFDPAFDENKAKPTGKSVSVNPSRKDDPILLIRESGSTLREGKVRGRLFDANDGALSPGQTASIDVNGAFYKLEAFGSVSLDPAGNPSAVKDYEIFLTHKNSRQSLLKHSGLKPADYRRRLFWAGDLDQDGRVDLLLDLAPQYNATVLTLFLSSAAKVPELVRKVARFVTTGC